MYDIVYPTGTKKALTMRFDDAPTGDKRMISLLSEYGLRATFYISVGMLSRPGHIAPNEIAELYRDQEVANHTYSHIDPRRVNMSSEEVREELLRGKRELEAIVRRPVTGYGYVCSTFGNIGEAEYKKLLADTGHLYAVMGRESRGFLPDIPDSFDVGQSFRFSDPDLISAADSFALCNPDDLSIFFAMAHTYEFDRPEFDYGWDKVTSFFRRVAFRSDIWYVTNGELLEYLFAAKRFLSEKSGKNNSSIPLFFRRQGELIRLLPGESLDAKK